MAKGGHREGLNGKRWNRETENSHRAEQQTTVQDRHAPLVEDLSFAEKPLQTVKQNDYLYVLDYLSFSFLYLRAAKIRCFTLYFDFSRA